MADALHRAVAKNWILGIIASVTMTLAGWYVPAIVTGVVMIAWNVILYMVAERTGPEGGKRREQH